MCEYQSIRLRFMPYLRVKERDPVSLNFYQPKADQYLEIYRGWPHTD